MDLKNKDFWENQALKHGNDIQAVNFDPLGEDLERFELKKVLADKKRICDLGCGNGATILNIAKDFKKAMFNGIDFSSNMIEAAKKKKADEGITNINFLNESASSANLIKHFQNEKFDAVITKRLFINIKDDHERMTIIKNIYDLLDDDGIFVMVECFMEPLNKINYFRVKLGLEEIKVKDFNKYLTRDFLKIISDYFIVDCENDFQSLYYFNSRVINAYLSEGNPDYLSPINKLTAELTKFGFDALKGFCPQIMFILKKII